MSSKFRLSLPLKTAVLRETFLLLVQESSQLGDVHKSLELSPALGQMLLEIEKSEPLNMVQLTSSMGLDKSTISQSLAQLQRNQWIEMRENPDDRRYKIVTLTISGEEKAEQLRTAIESFFDRCLAPLKQEERNAIAYGLGLLSYRLRDNRMDMQASQIKQPLDTATETQRATEV